MLAKQNRLRSTKEITEVYNKGKYLLSPHFRANYDFKGGDVASLAVVIPAKAGKANIRNLIRRRVKYTFSITPVSKLPALRLIISTRKGAEMLEYSETKKELLELFSQISKLENSKNEL